MKEQRLELFEDIRDLEAKGKKAYKSEKGSEVGCQKSLADMELAWGMREKSDKYFSESFSDKDKENTEYAKYMDEMHKLRGEKRFDVIAQDRSSAATIKRIFVTLGLIATVAGFVATAIYQKATTGQWMALFRNTSSERQADRAMHAASRIGKVLR